MIGLLVVVLLAAIVGVIKPYIRPLKRGHFALAAVVSFILIGTLSPKVASGPQNADSVQSPAKTDVAAASSRADEPQAKGKVPETKWDYSDDKDAMRGTTTHYASIESENQVDLDFPYGVVHGKIWIRKRPEDGLRIMFAVDKGQILCNSFSHSTVSIKFDDAPIRQFRCTSSTDGSSETAFLESESSALSSLKKARRTIIEAEFYQKARQQFVFDTSGLDWKW